MKKIKTFIISLVLAIIFSIGFEAVKVQADIAGFRAALISAFTANFTPGQRQEISNSFTTAFGSEWQKNWLTGLIQTITTAKGNLLPTK